MIEITFKNVGQGDSIIIEWTVDKVSKIGIIDCREYNCSNEVIKHLSQRKISEIEFIILSHLHHDHYSGMADLFEFCLQQKISVKYFYSTMHPMLLDIYNRIFTSQKIQKDIDRLIKTFEQFDEIIEDSIQISKHLEKLCLTSEISLSFLAPAGRLYDHMAKQLSRKVNKITTSHADINKLAPIILIDNKENAIILTSDAVKKSFSNIKIVKEVVLVQIPHHGSWGNISIPFWCSLAKISECPAIASVGDEPKDKLPDVDTISFFDKLGYKVYSTNAVYGISDYFSSASTNPTSSTSLALNSFSTLISRHSTIAANNQYNGEQKFELLN